MSHSPKDGYSVLYVTVSKDPLEPQRTDYSVVLMTDWADALQCIVSDSTKGSFRVTLAACGTDSGHMQSAF